MTELFDPEIDKETLPRHDVSARHCALVALFAVSSTALVMSIADGSIDLRQIWRQSSFQSSDPEHEGFCANLAKQNPAHGTFADLLNRSFCNAEPGPTSP